MTDDLIDFTLGLQAIRIRGLVCVASELAPQMSFFTAVAVE